MRKNCSKLSVILFSIFVIFTFTGCPGGTSFFSLEAPQNLSVDNIYSDMIELSWDSQSSISGYVLYISLDDSFESAQALDVSKNNAVAISGFQSSTTYYFRVTAYTYTSESAPSEMVSATTLVGAPQGVKISFSNDNNDITLSWDAVPRATGYKYYYGLSSDMANNDFGEILNKNSGSISVTIKDGASSKGLYHVWVLGKDDNSVSSNYAYGIKRKGSPNYKFYKENGPYKEKSSHSLGEVSDDTEVFLIKVNSDEYSVGKDRTGGVTKVYNNFEDNSEKFYAKYSILGKPISRSSEINPTFSDDTTVVRLDHLPSKKNLFDINNMKSVTSRSGSVVQSRSYSDFKEYSIGTTKKFWIDDANGNFSQKTATLVAEGDYSYVWVVNDVLSNSSTLKNDNKITTSQANLVAQKFDYIYGPETTVFGETYKDIYNFIDSPSKSGLVPPEEKISILICDIFGDYSSNQSGGILGYFWNKDFFNDDVTKSQGIRSNEAEIFYIDSHFLDAFTDMTYSTLAHEFQHMLNYVNKDIKHEKTPTVWYNEMLSMVCEDLLQDFIGIEDKDSPRGRLPQFNYGYAFNGAEEWFNDANTLNSYAHAYAFGAFITRNYGGASLVKYIMGNEYVDLDSIIEAIRDITGNYNYYKEDLLFEFARALCYPEGFEGSEDDPSTPLGKAKAKGIKHFYRENSSQSGGYTYNLKPICLFDYSFKYADENGNVKTNFGPFYFGVGNILDLRPYGISIHSFGVKSGKFTFDYIPPSHAYVDDYFVIQ